MLQQAKDDAGGGKEDEFEQSGEERVRIIERVKAIRVGQEGRKAGAATAAKRCRASRSSAPSRRKGS